MHERLTTINAAGYGDDTAVIQGVLACDTECPTSFKQKDVYQVSMAVWFTLCHMPCMRHSQPLADAGLGG